MRAQAHTLEGVAAALIVVAAVAFTLQGTAVTPLTASTASQHIETQHERAAASVLETSRGDGSLSETLRYWNASGGEFANTSEDGYYVGDPPNTTFGRALAATFGGDRAIAYNVNVYYVTDDGDRRQRRVVYTGAPSADSVGSTRTVTVYDDQQVVNERGTAVGPSVENASYLGPDTPGAVYGVYTVEVVAWRT
ncbi:DUF7288 family protein [Halobacterium jilantaiense]|uniref:Uncharacterized protein n=1 Tax=Halobacterium jilantaiense TaxID=355548 RepID=A0A1I0N5V3_9EURY|nr:hypothetical protein [Halobacterium jilantaiense]SEV96245.1 hypothetical protein SAMN04487945_0616 [Halobacterium jilantaiense]